MREAHPGVTLRNKAGRIEVRGSSSGVEHHVANVVVVGSNPISRSGVLVLGWPLSLERVGCVMADQAVPA